MANTGEIKKLYSTLKNTTKIKDPDNPNKTVDFSKMPENDFIKKMESKDGRNNFFKRYWTVLNDAGINLGKYNDYEKKYGGATTQTVKLSLEKLLDIDDRILETNDPNQVIRYYKTQNHPDTIGIFYNNGRWIQRYGKKDNKDGQISGYWNFVGDDNYQIKWGQYDETQLYDFKTGKTTKVSGEAPPSVEDVAKKQKEDAKTNLDAERKAKLHPTLKKLMDIDSTLEVTSSPNQIKYPFDNKIQVFFPNGYWLQREKSLDNTEGEHTGKWYFDGEDNYKIIDNTSNYIYDLKKEDWTKIKKPFKWNEVNFTLDDVAAGKAVLKRGDSGPAVEELQKLMIKMNLSKVSKSGEPDGKYGKLTELSIRQFQNEMPRGEQDGKVGRRTLSRMLYLYNYDPDKEVDDVQTNSGTTQMPLDGQNVEPNTAPQSAPATSDTTQAPTQTKRKLGITPDAENLNESVKKIVSENLKSLIK